MTRLTFAAWSIACASLAACFESHDGTRAITFDDCLVCHEATWLDQKTQDAHSAAAPGQTFPTTCGNCHATTSWQPALRGPHPAPNTFTAIDSTTGAVVNDTFLIQPSTPHATIRCLECHDLAIAEPEPTSRGFNANCTQCHLDDTYQREVHGGEPGYAYQSDAAGFCRSCHPQGLAKKHPWDRFPQHHGATCRQCHVRARGPNADGVNTSCIECHEHDHEDGHHDEVGRYFTFKSSPPNETTRVPPRQLTSYNFCLACHPNGRKE